MNVFLISKTVVFWLGLLTTLGYAEDRNGLRKEDSSIVGSLLTKMNAYGVLFDVGMDAKQNSLVKCGMY